MTDYISVIEVLAIHADQIEKYGGADGIRDLGALEAALYRPQTGYYDSLLEQAAALWESLGQNHPFVDGNKRTSFAATLTLLLVNGVRITSGHSQTFNFIDRMYRSGSFEYGTLLEWLQKNTDSENYS